mgnify:CR=1 FL=1
MNDESWARPRAFSHIIESFFPNIEVGQAAYHFARRQDHDAPGTSPMNRDFITYAFLSALRHTGRCGSGPGPGAGSKFRVLRDAVLENPFVGPSQRSIVLSKFARAQRTYVALAAGARRHKRARARRAHANEDMFLRPLAALPSCAVMELYDDASRTVYTFRLSDLIRLAKSSLCHAPEFFVDPQAIRNPYTGVEFTTAQLYTIYEAIRRSPYEIPAVLHLYRRGGFSVQALVDRGEAFIREEAIDSVRSIDEGQQSLHITRMLQDYDDCVRGLPTHPATLGHDVLLDAFGRFLPVYLRTTLSLHPDLRTRSRLRLQAELSRFAAQNPALGQARAGGDAAPRAGGGAESLAPIRRTPLMDLRARRRRRLARLLQAVGARARETRQIEEGIMQEAGAEQDNDNERALGMHAEREEHEAAEIAEAARGYEESDDSDASMQDAVSQDAPDEDELGSSGESERSDSPPRPAEQEVTYVPVAPPTAEATLQEAFTWFSQASHGGLAGGPEGGGEAREQNVINYPLIQAPPPAPDRTASPPSPSGSSDAVSDSSPAADGIAIPQTQALDPSGSALGPRRPFSADRLRGLSRRV